MPFKMLSTNLVSSSLWSLPPATRVVFLTALSRSDNEGFYHASRSGFLRESNVTQEEFDRALIELESPDPDSRDMDYGGARLSKIEGGWLILNHDKYHQREEVKREQAKIRMQKMRSNKVSPSHTLPLQKDIKIDVDIDSSRNSVTVTRNSVTNASNRAKEAAAEFRPTTKVKTQNQELVPRTQNDSDIIRKALSILPVSDTCPTNERLFRETLSESGILDSQGGSWFIGKCTEYRDYIDRTRSADYPPRIKAPQYWLIDREYEKDYKPRIAPKLDLVSIPRTIRRRGAYAPTIA